MLANLDLRRNCVGRNAQRKVLPQFSLTGLVIGHGDAGGLDAWFSSRGIRQENSNFGDRWMSREGTFNLIEFNLSLTTTLLY